MVRDTGNIIAGQNLYFARIRIGGWIVRRRKRYWRQERCLDVGIAGVNVPTIRGIGGADVDAFAQRITGVGEKPEGRIDWTWNTVDIVIILGVIAGDAPVEPARRPSPVDYVAAFETGFDGPGDNLLQRRVGGEEIIDDARRLRARATDFKRRRRAIGF